MNTKSFFARAVSSLAFVLTALVSQMAHAQTDNFDSGTLDAAVARAMQLARRGDAVVLSPACASFDWYPDGGYPARGDDFKRLVQEHA